MCTAFSCEEREERARWWIHSFWLAQALLEHFHDCLPDKHLAVCFMKEAQHPKPWYYVVVTFGCDLWTCQEGSSKNGSMVRDRLEFHLLDKAVTGLLNKPGFARDHLVICFKNCLEVSSSCWLGSVFWKVEKHRFHSLFSMSIWSIALLAQLNSRG